MLFDGLPIRRFIASRLIQVGLARIERIHAQGPGDILDDGFYGHHALGATETPKGGVGNRVGFATQPEDGSTVQVVGVVGMKHRPVDNAFGQVRGITALASQHHFGGLDASVIVKADLPAVEKIVALAGLDHVVPTRHPVTHRPTQAVSEKRTQARQRARLTFLATEPAAHATDFGDHMMKGQRQHFRHQLLNFGGVLGRADDMNAAILGETGLPHLTFEVKVLLAAHVDLAFDPVGRTHQFAVGVTHHQMMFRQNVAVRSDRLLYRQMGDKGLVLHLGQGHRPQRGFLTGGRHRKNGLAHIFHFVARKQWIATVHRRHVNLAGNVGLHHHIENPGGSSDAAQIHTLDARMRLNRLADSNVCQIDRHREIINITGSAGHVLARGFMSHGPARGERGGTVFRAAVGQLTHE